MDNVILVCALRKVLKNIPLDSQEKKIYECWREINENKTVFESATKRGSSVLQHIEGLRSLKNLRYLFDRIFIKNRKKDANTNGKRELPIVINDKLNIANIITSTGKNAAHYELWEISELVPSHDPFNQFQRRDAYPAQAQERPYHSDCGEQTKVRRNAANLEPRYLLNTNPDALTGPPIVTSTGIVLGGNSRAMSLQLAAAVYPKKIEEYKQYLYDAAEMFGFAPEQVARMKQPVLVRVMEDDMDSEDMAQMSRRFNEVTT